MTVIKCKVCDGDIQTVTGQTYATCGYCGETVTLPNAPDNIRANLFNRANHFRRLGEFDKGLAAYKNILTDNDADAEAHWGVVLCRYGVEYVEDTANHNCVPACRIAQYEPIFSDPDYLAAIERSRDDRARSLYEQEARAIAEIQKGILAVSQNEAPFDVFICCKEKTAGGGRTKDSVVAQKIYDQISQAGYRVFFARVTLEDKSGAPEPYIFSALNSARVMLVIGTSPEYFNAVWVKNEWSRYMAIMARSPGRLLIPCYYGFDLHDLPEELSSLQAQNMSKVGFTQNLIQEVQKALELPKPPEPPAIEPLLARARLFLSDGYFERSGEYCDRALDIEAGCAEAYMMKFLAENEFKTENDIVPRFVERFEKKALGVPLNTAKTFEKLTPLILNDSERKIINILEANKILDKDFIGKCLRFEPHLLPVAAFEEAARDFSYPDGSLNYQNALRFAGEDKREVYSGYVKEIRGVIEAREKSEKDEIKNIEQENIENSSRHAFILIPLLQEAESEIKRQREEFKQKETESGFFANIFGSASPVAAPIAFYKASPKLREIFLALSRELLSAGNYEAALIVSVFEKSGSFSDAIEALLANLSRKSGATLSWRHISSSISRYCLSVKNDCGVKVETDGTVVADANNEYGQRDTIGWRDIVAVDRGNFHTVGLAVDGTVVADGNNEYGQCDVADWRDIVAVAAGGEHTVGLNADGTVVAVGDNSRGQCDVEKWTGIVAIAAEHINTIALRADGTIVFAGRSGENDQCKVNNQKIDWLDCVPVIMVTMKEGKKSMKEYSIGLVPGPVSVPRKIREAWLTDFGSADLESEFFEIYAKNQTLTQKLLGTKESVVITSGEAMSILWGSLKSTLRPGDRLLAVASGLFGEGFADMGKDIGAEVETVASEYDSLPDPEKVRGVALRFRPKIITAVHCETPSGTLNPLKELGEIAREVDALFLVDFVSSGGGVAVDADANHIDIGLLGSQKALSLPPSLSVSVITAHAWAAIEKVRYSGYDAYLPWKNVPKSHAMPYTHDWHSMTALNISLSAIMEEGQERVFARHFKAASLCRKMASEMGLKLFPISEAICSPTVSAFYVPEGWTWEKFDAALRERGLAVGGNYGSLAGKVFRIGHMGSQADDALITRGMEIIKDVLKK
ncbi:hypothetical protein AGMMS50276_12320 [Synergistales bacterium]|nr:hypothetical protein AGMMS50276_12320 [Synergistales bacterium]